MLAPWVLGPALLLLALVALSAWRRPILLRMALRNLGRRRMQALAIALGLMVGTALIAGALATGDSMNAAIRDTAVRAFGELDESVALEGRLYFPEAAVAALEADPRVRAATEAIAPILLEDAAVANPRTRQSEPRVALIGLDPRRDAAFGRYATSQGPVDLAALGPGEAALNERLAESLGARVGDSITVRYAQRPEPLVPRLYVFNGSLAAGAGSPVPLPLPGLPPPYAGTPVDEAEFGFPVEAGAVRVTGALFWGSPGDQTDLDLLLRAPDGSETWNPNGTLGSPDAPALLNATAQPGAWTARVLSKAAANQGFTLVVLVFYEVRDLGALMDFLEEVERRPEARAFVRSLAGELRLEARNFTVRHIALEPGRGSFLNAPDVFVRLDVAQEMLAKEGKVNLVMVSNPGDLEEGLAGTATAMEALNASLADLQAGGDPAFAGLRARPLKQEWVEEANRAGGLFTSFLTSMSSFSILAGLILIVNVFVMLTEERRGELGIARALGLTRGEVTRLFLYEGAVYAVLASAAGALLGLLVSLGLIAALNTTLSERLLLQLPFRPTPDALLVAFGAGVLMTLIATLLASQRAARLNIVRSIRRLEEPDTPLGRTAGLAGAGLLALGLPLTAWALASGNFTLLVAGPNLAVLGAALLSARALARSSATILAGAAMFLYNLATVFAFDTPADLEGMVLGPLRGVLIVLGAVLVLVNSRRFLEAAVSLLSAFRAFRPIARTALAYPLHRKLRTGLTVVMFGLVLTIIVLFSVFFAMFSPNLAEQGGGYDVAGETTLPVQDLAARLQAAAREEPALRGVRDVTSLAWAEVWGGRLLAINGERVRYQGPPVDYVYGFDADFARTQDFPLLELHPDYAAPREAYEAVLRDPSLIIVSRTYTNGPDGRPGYHHVGDPVVMKTRAGNLTFTIVGVQKQIYYGGVFVAKPVVESNFDSLHGLHLLHTRPGSDPSAVARALEASQEEVGMDAASVEEEAQRILAAQRQLYALFEVYLGLGLVLGVASLGIITARSVLERRQEVGMLRAIGLPRRLVFRAFLLEGVFIVGLGALVGVGVGLVVAWGVQLQALAPLGIGFVVPWADLLVILGVAFLCTLAATLGPARRAARLPPAEAIRYIE